MKRTGLLLACLALCGPLAAWADMTSDVLAAQAANMRAARQYNWFTTYWVRPEDGKTVAVAASARVSTTGEVLQEVVADNENSEGVEVWDGTGAESPRTKEGYLRLSEVAKLIYRYSLMTPAELEGFLTGAESEEGGGSMEGTTVFDGTGVLASGDEVRFWIDSGTALPRKMVVSTSAIDLPVEVTVAFRTLGNGVVVVDRGRVTVPGQTVVVDFKATGYRFSN